MKKYLTAFFVLLLSLSSVKLSAGSHAYSQSINLKGAFEKQLSSIRLNWNMIKSSSRTGYILIKSNDGKKWYEAAKDETLRDHTEKDVYNFDDKLFEPGSKNYYRIRIFDAENNTVAVSPIVVITPNEPPAISTSSIEISPSSNWSVFPNPVSDILNLSYKGNEKIKGVINVLVTDMTGKPVKQFRAASTNRSVEIPVNNLRKGMYAVQISIQNELVLSDKFIKQ
jgi:hypothetical protein